MSKEAAIDREFDKRTEKLDFTEISNFIQKLSKEIEELNQKFEVLAKELEDLKL
jgi:prefoldin subunit 5